MITNRAILKKCIVFVHLFSFNFDTNVQKSATTSHKKRLTTSISLNLQIASVHERYTLERVFLLAIVSYTKYKLAK